MKFFKLQNKIYVFIIILFICSLSNVITFTSKKSQFNRISQSITNDDKESAKDIESKNVEDNIKNGIKDIISENNNQIDDSKNKKRTNKQNINFTQNKQKCTSEVTNKYEYQIYNKKITKNPLKENGIGFGLSGVLFDYLDPVLRKPIVEDFNELYKAAQNIQESIDYNNKLSFVQYFASNYEMEEKYNTLKKN